MPRSRLYSKPTKQAERDNMRCRGSVKLVFCGEIALNLDDGRQVEVSAFFEPKNNTILIGLDTIQKQNPNIDLADLVFLHAAHETRHKIQTVMNDQPPDTRHTMAAGTYKDSRHEVEAWQSTVRAWAEWRPTNF